ncbi:MAG: Lrp/AsnC family transcriptional regulator [Candidatus Bathyarchaeia archaeon]
MRELDDLDLRILSTLQRNARSSFSSIAKALGVSEGTVHLRVKKLLKKGIIKGFFSILNPEKLGIGMKAIICLKADPQRYEEVLKSLLDIPDIHEIYDVTGEFYSVLKVRTKNKESLAQVIDRIGRIPGITSTSTMVVLRSVKEELLLNLEELRT